MCIQSGEILYDSDKWVADFCLPFQTHMTTFYDYLQIHLKYSVHAAIDDYSKDGGSGEVWLLCSCHHDPLQP